MVEINGNTYITVVNVVVIITLYWYQNVAILFNYNWDDICAVVDDGSDCRTAAYFNIS